MKFNEAFKLLIGHEGGFQNDYFDRGNWTSGIIGKGKRNGTKFGITAMSYPYENIRNLSLDRAREIYKRDFWDRLKLDDITPPVRFQVFDMAVNSGLRNAAKTLQRAVNATPDGKIGPLTLAKANKVPAAVLVARFAGQRLLFITGLRWWKRFGKGWARRIAHNLIKSGGSIPHG